jgi:hypothetical protein
MSRRNNHGLCRDITRKTLKNNPAKIPACAEEITTA